MPKVGHGLACVSYSLAHILAADRTDILQVTLDQVHEDMGKLFGLYQGHYEKLIAMHGELVKMYQAVMLKKIITAPVQPYKEPGGVIMEQPNGRT